MREASLARSYYEAIDDDEYERLSGLLAADFVHERPDMTLDGRDRFVSFMRDERPMTDTEHVIETVYTTDPTAADGPSPGVAVQGQLRDATGAELFEFLDVFTARDGRLTRLETYVPLTPTE